MSVVYFVFLLYTYIFQYPILSHVM